MLPSLLVLTLVLGPPMASAALFPSNTQVKMIDAKGFRKAMKANMTSVVAFVAPWCGHCQRMAPEYSRAALGLYPLVPLYAVDCDDSKNKKLCAEQGVTGFPTVKLFPRGTQMKSITYDAPERTASAFFYWASRNIPSKIAKVHPYEKISEWAEGSKAKPRALLMDKTNKPPLLWKVLANKYRDHIEFGRHRDKRGKDSVKLGFPAGEDGKPKVLIYPAEETTPVMFEGIMKYDSLSKFFDSVIDGTADLRIVNKEASEEEFVVDPKELEIQQQQEAEMLKLAHGGYADIIDFEKAVKDGHGADFHAMNGYPGMMGGAPPHAPAPNEKAGGSEGALKESSVAQGEVPKSTGKVRMPMTDEGGQIVLEATTETGQPRTPAAEPTPATEPEPVVEPIVDSESVSEALVEDLVDDPEVEPEEPIQGEVTGEDGSATSFQMTEEHVTAPTSTPLEEHVKDEL